MIKFLLRFLSRQKLLLGILWLMLRGSSVDGQIDTTKEITLCYVSIRRVTYSNTAEVSISGDFNTYTNETALLADYTTRFNRVNAGITTKFSISEGNIFVGPELKITPVRINHFHLNTGFYYLFPLGKVNTESWSFYQEIVYVSNLSLWGYGLYHTFSTNLIKPSGMAESFGIKIHYSFQF